MNKHLLFLGVFTIAWISCTILWYRYPNFFAPTYTLNFIWRKGKFVKMSEPEALKYHRQLMVVMGIVGLVFVAFMVWAEITK